MGAWSQERREAWLAERERLGVSTPPVAPSPPEPPLVVTRDPDAPLVLVDRRSVVTQRLRAVAHHVGGKPGPDGDWVGGVLVELEVEVPADHAKPRCVKLEVSPYGTGRVTSAGLRFPVDRLVARAMAAATLRLEPGPDDDRWFELTTTELTPAAQEQIAARSSERQPRKGAPVTDDALQRAVHIYRQAKREGKPPTKAVAEAMRCDPSTAKRYLTKAVEKGLLDPSERLDHAAGARSRAKRT